MKMNKKIKIIKQITCHGGFVFDTGEIHSVISEGVSSEKNHKLFIVNSHVVKNNVVLPIAIYANECEIVN